MHSISVISSTARCILRFCRKAEAQHFGSKLNGWRMLSTSSYDVTSLNERLNQADRRHDSWNNEIPKMTAVWNDIVHDIREMDHLKFLPEVAEWITESLNYNVIGGNARRYFSVVHAYKKLVPKDQLTEENLRLARILGWCHEMYAGAAFAFDDIIDQAETRRYKECWYKKNDLGRFAILDSMNIQFLIYALIRRHFQGRPYYSKIIDSFQQYMSEVIIAVIAETQTTNLGKKPDLDKFSMDFYFRMIHVKSTASFIVPIHHAIYHAGRNNPETLKQSKIILNQLGLFFQVQNDYWDSFGNSELKSQRDIQEGTFAWPIVAALERATPEQKTILKECYGEKDPEKVAKVKQLFEDIGVPKMYAEYEEESYNYLTTLIQQISCDLPHEIFFMMRDNVYGTSADRSQIFN